MATGILNGEVGAVYDTSPSRSLVDLPNRSLADLHRSMVNDGLPADRLLGDLPVFFNGWKSTLLALHASGWKLEWYRRQDMMAVQMMLRHPELQLVGINLSYHMLQNTGHMPPLEFGGVYSNITMSMEQIEPPVYKAVSEGDLLDPAINFIRHVVTYNGKGTDAPNLIYDKEDLTISELLEKIKEKQQSKQAELREKARKTPLDITKDTIRLVAA